MTSNPRYGSAAQLIRLTLDLASTHYGKSIDEIAESFEITRRTAERRLAALKEIYPNLEYADSDDRIRRWRLPLQGIRPLLDVTKEELAALAAAEKLLRRERIKAGADRLRDLSSRLQARMDPKIRTPAQTDLELLIESEGFALRPGPKPVANRHHLEIIRTALLASSELTLTYQSRSSGKISLQRVQPYGLLYGSRHYLVAFSPDVIRDLKTKDGWRYFVLDGIKNVEGTGQSFVRDTKFDLARYAARSFGTFQDDKPARIELIFDAEAAADAQAYDFHPSQSMSNLRDGRLKVTFTASGLLEVCWHLFTWGSAVKVMAPAELQTLYRKCLSDARKSL
jgi:predicted DNA-binding transcriptional regulator YafY